MTHIKATLLILLVFITSSSHAFLPSKLHPCSSIITESSSAPCRNHKSLCQLSSSSPEDTNSNGNNNRRRVNNEQFLEESSRSGYHKVKSMSIEERTQRAMLAEAAEDRVVMLSDELELLLGEDGMPLTVEDREEVTILAKQIKASREQYSRLVNGEDCSSLDMFNMGTSGRGDNDVTSTDEDLDLQ
mmetsp:Transcript_14750/g.22352  ORF Transcript_14750/g.22352 Transcript_14750/m.22352 type:complete len:187 (+) Transcript_14750:191-751(+)|eukprot:CAMPEP_0203674556 /NCGR_PEP_ID=MMETSP0090-20130426/16660_1 /ASSEMBLY_ACC=CAM_ASM_001088 /TAXON_ID=426623 /ORGANISM="Chaetoceros affinis, Strain CCMP159" /LENGTH=186 /DNA_ID=CAMNT_0050540477 /DNA_START=114 /DNA_END=674 /DNA_ORIENTATION=-